MLDRDTIAIADWKDAAGLIESLAILLADHGIRLTDHSNEYGSDDFVVTVTKMSDPAPTVEDVWEALGVECEDDVLNPPLG